MFESEDMDDEDVVGKAGEELSVEVKREFEGVPVKSCAFRFPIFSEFLEPEWDSSTCNQ